MSSLKTQLQDAMKDAMRVKDKARLDAIRLLLAAIKQREVDERVVLDDDQIIAVLDKQAKQRRESIAQFKEADRHDLVEKEQAELDIIQTFLPEAMSEAEISAVIQAAITETGATSIKDMGKVMGVLKPKLQGRADLSLVSTHIKQLLG